MSVDVEELIDRIELSEYIGQYCELEERNGEYWALSPLTHEKTPSFSVASDGRVFYDFSSGQGGGIIKFIMLYHRVDSETAIRMAAQYAGIDPDAPEHRRFESTKTLKRLNRMGKELKQGTGIFLDPGVMDRYEFDLDKLKPWTEEGISVESLRKFQVRYDPHGNNILYPVRDEDGNILVIGARTADPDWKQKGLRKYVYLSKWGVCNTLYGLYENKKAILDRREVIIFEGAKSVMKADTWGIGNTVAALTSKINDHQLRLLIRLGCDVVVGFDKGVDPKADATIRKLRHFVKVSAIVDTYGLLEDKDAPVDKGKDVFLTLYNNRVRLN